MSSTSVTWAADVQCWACDGNTGQEQRLNRSKKDREHPPASSASLNIMNSAAMEKYCAMAPSFSQAKLGARPRVYGNNARGVR